jgi:hypothetical protein
VVHYLLFKTGLIKPGEKPGEKHYPLRVHSIRKFFKTNLVGAGVPESHADCMMAHVEDTSNQVRDLGVDRLRESYARGQLCILLQSQQNLTRR